MTHPAHIEAEASRSRSDRIADGVAEHLGSWPFIIGQALFTAGWIVLNTLHGWANWDKYPFVLLNLVYSFQAGFTGPILLLAGNRQAALDRAVRDHDHEASDENIKLTREIHAAVVKGAS